MAHEHHHVESDSLTLDRNLWATLALNVGITLSEFIAGLLSASISLLSDAAHNLGDVVAVVLAIVARRMGRRPPTLRHTFGLKRVEVLSALANSLTLVGITVLIGREAIVRLLHPEPVNQQMMLIVASIAVLGNVASVFLLRRHDKDDVNMRAAFLHMAQDALSSLAVVVAALFAHTSFGPYLDAVAALLISLVVLRGAIQLTWKTLSNLLESAPDDIDIEAIARESSEAFTPASLHHVHVWELGPGQKLLTAHVTLGQEMDGHEIEALLAKMKHFLFDRWEINHATIEPEIDSCSNQELLGSWESATGMGEEGHQHG